jgi:hypothetical protein
MYVDDNINFKSSNNFFPVTANNWIFITVVFNGVSVKLYKNGVLSQTITRIGTVTSTNHFLVGYSQNGGYYAGGIDDIAVYNQVLTDAEIGQLRYQTISKY